MSEDLKIEIMEWMIATVKEGVDEENENSKYMGIHINHVNKTSDLVGYFEDIDSCANFLGVIANPERSYGVTEFVYARFWKKTEAEYHLYEVGRNVMIDFKPLQSWIIVGIEWDNRYERLDKHIENVS